MKHRSRFKTLRDFVDSHSRRVSQNEIARRLGISSSLLSHYLHGTRRPSPTNAMRLAREFNIELEGLLAPEMFTESERRAS